MNLPAVAPDVVAGAVAALPNRLRSKLDQAVDRQATWTVTPTAEGAVVAIDDEVTVTLTGPVDAAGKAVCSCLLAPRCLHRAAVLSAAPVLAPDSAPADPAPAGPPPAEPAHAVVEPSPDVPAFAGLPSAVPASAGPSAAGSPSAVGDGADSPPGDAPGDAAPAGSGPAAGRHPPGPAGAELRSVGAAEVAAVHLVRVAAAQVLERGVPGAGAVVQADLLRAVHQARAVGLPRIAAATTRVVEQLRAARAGTPGFRLADLCADLREMLTIGHRLLADAADPHARGVNRRGYEPVGDLRVYGLLTEPLRTATGHVGAVTYLVDDAATTWSVATVRPGDPASARNPANASVDLGEVTLSHRELARAGVLAAQARASPDRRLGQGRAVQAVRTPGRGWHAEPAAALWRRPVDEQVERWLVASDGPPHERPAGHDLAFLDGVLAADRRGLLLEVAGLPAPVLVLAPHDDPSLPYVANLRHLVGYAVGQRVRMVTRFAGPLLVHGLAISAPWLPQRFGSHLDLGVDQLQRADLPGGAPAAPSVPDLLRPPLHLLAHHLHRVVAAGRAALVPDVDDDLRRLSEAQLPTAAAVLRGLREAGLRRQRDPFGRLGTGDATLLATAWLVAAAYEHAASTAAIRRAWSPR